MPKKNFDIPDEARFTETHEYVKYDEDEDRALIGISGFAAEQLGDIVFVELPDVGDSFEQGETFGSIESVKAASDLYMPVSGEITSINTQLSEEPDLISDNPYQDGWLMEIVLKNKDQIKELMDADKYAVFLEEQESAT